MPDATGTTQQHQAARTAAWATTVSDLKRALEQWFQGMQTCSDEISRFVQARALLTMEAWSALRACRSPEQMVEHQRHFTAKAMEQCAKELTSLSQLALRMGSSEPSK